MDSDQVLIKQLLFVSNSTRRFGSGPLSCVINVFLLIRHARDSRCLHINHSNGQVWLMGLRLVCHRISCPWGGGGATVPRSVLFVFPFVLQVWTGGGTVCGGGRAFKLAMPSGG